MSDKKPQVVVSILGNLDTYKKEFIQFVNNEIGGSSGIVDFKKNVNNICAKAFNISPANFSDDALDKKFVKPVVFEDKNVRLVLAELQKNVPQEVLAPLKLHKIGVQKFAGASFNTPRAVVAYICGVMIPTVWPGYYAFTAASFIKGYGGLYFLTNVTSKTEIDYLDSIFKLHYTLKLKVKGARKADSKIGVDFNESLDGVEPFASVSYSDLTSNKKEAINSFKVINSDVEEKIASFLEPDWAEMFEPLFKEKSVDRKVNSSESIQNDKFVFEHKNNIKHVVNDLDDPCVYEKKDEELVDV